MTVVPKVGEVFEHRVVSYNGVDYPKDSETTVTTFVTNQKVSVDTGSFVPGVYRVNPYYVSEETMGAGGGYSIRYVTPDGLRVYNYDVYGAVALKASVICKSRTPAFLDHGNHRTRALVQAEGKLAGAQLELGEAIGELKETIQMLRSPLKNLREYLFEGRPSRLLTLKKLSRYTKTGAWSGAKTAAAASKAAAGAWMEIRYGLRPLMYMVQDAMEMVEKADKKGFSPSLIRSVQGRSGKSDVVMSPTLSSAISAYTGGYFTCKSEREFMAYASVQYTQSRPNTSADDFGLSLPFLPETAWELTRLSFVLDWFVQIGPWLGKYRVKPHITVLGNTVSLKQSVKTTAEVQLWSKDDATKSNLGSYSGGAFNTSNFERVVNYNSPVYPLFTGGDVIDLFRAIDGAAIILQKLL